MEKIELKINLEYVRGVIENPESQDIVVLVHWFTWDWNWPDDIFLKLSKKLQEKWFAVCRFNFRGTWNSDWEFIDMTVKQEIEDLKNIIRFLESKKYTSIKLLWESMWWTVIWWLNNFQNIDAIIFWYTAFDLFNTDLKELLLSEKWNNEYIKEWFIMCDWFKVWWKFIKEFTNINIYNNLKNIFSPVLFLHWDNDKEVLYTQSAKAYKEISSNNKKLTIIEWADHCFLNEQDLVIEETLLFLNEDTIL